MIPLLAAISACGGRHVIPAQLEPDVQFERGMEAYEAGRWGRAVEHLQPFAIQSVGDPRLPDAIYALARSHEARREYIAAAGEFIRLATEFPNDPRSVEARLGACKSYAALSPRPQLDQEYTRAALQHCTMIAQSYPNTPQAEEAQTLVDEARHTLARKAYETGLFYFRRRAYDAAVIYFQDAAASYPDTSVAPAALLRLHEAFSRIGYVEDAEATRERLLEQYPQSSEARELRASIG